MMCLKYININRFCIVERHIRHKLVLSLLIAHYFTANIGPCFANNLYPLEYLRSADYLLQVTNSDISDFELSKYDHKLKIWNNRWSQKLLEGTRLLSSLANPAQFQPLVEQLDSLVNQIVYESYDLISALSFSQLACDQLFQRISTDIFKNKELIIQVFEPVQLHSLSHPCLNRISKIYQDFNNSQPHNIAPMKSLDWKLNKVSAQELIIYLWARRSSWHAYAANYAKDITPSGSPISEYSKLTHRMMRRNKNYKSKIEISSESRQYAVLNLDLLKLLHPFIWRYDINQSNYFQEGISFEKLLRSIITSDFGNVLRGKEQSSLLETRYEQYLRNARLAYVSNTEKDSIDQKILNDINHTISQLKKDFQIGEIIFANLNFAWEKNSLRAFQTIGKSNLRDLTGPAIKFLFKKFGITKNKSAEILELLHEQGLIQK
ncbi:MAG: hypothetical protein VX619_00250 [bacterium]|nr:hypothetical protein [bacterium]